MTLEPHHVDYLRAIPERVREGGMFGLDHVVQALLCALLTDGHVLLEGNPGLGKTALVHAMAKAIGIGDGAVGRIQFTPDLMPADITGTKMPDEDGGKEWRFRPGPIFKELLIADEINRATPKTQAAMLEAMGEGQVTVAGDTKPLRKTEPVGPYREVMTPFMVMATQNPIDQEGTFELPEAQSDRFMMKIRMRMPDAEVLSQIVLKAIAPYRESKKGASDAEQRAEGLRMLHEASVAVLSMRLSPVVLAHIVNLVLATNGQWDQLVGLSTRRSGELRGWLDGKVTYPFGPRAASAPGRGALAWAAVALTAPDKADVAADQAPRGLAAVLVPVLRHRIRVSDGVQGFAGSGAEVADGVDSFLRELAVRAAPDLAVGGLAAGYSDRFKAAMDEAAETVKL